MTIKEPGPPENSKKEIQSTTDCSPNEAADESSNVEIGFVPGESATTASSSSMHQAQVKNIPPVAPTNNPSQRDEKLAFKLSYAPSTSPFAAVQSGTSRTVSAEPSERNSIPMRANKNHLTSKHSPVMTATTQPVNPGAVSVVPTQINNRSRLTISDEENFDNLSSEFAEPGVTAYNNINRPSDLGFGTEHDIPQAFVVDDTDCYAVDPGAGKKGEDPTAIQGTPSKRRRTIILSIAAGVIIVSLVITLSVVLGSKGKGDNTAESGKSVINQFVQYKGVWSAALIGTYDPDTTKISDFEVSCQSGGILKNPVITSTTPAVQPTCTAENDSVLRCTQAPAFQGSSNAVVVDAAISFQCHGDATEQLVGQVAVFDTTIPFQAGMSQNEAQHLIVLQVIDPTTGGGENEGECSHDLLIVPGEDQNFLVCGYYQYCMDESFSVGCSVTLESRSEAQRFPFDSKYIQKM